MPFQLGNNYGNRYTSDNQPPNESKKHGPRRSDIARQVLALRVDVEEGTMETLKKSYPEIDGYLTGEELGMLLQLNKAITSQDTQALKLLLDSAYGAPTQAIEHTGEDGGPIKTENNDVRTWTILDHSGGKNVPSPDDDYHANT